MIQNYMTLLYVAAQTGKPVVAIYNDVESRWYFYLADTHTPANPSNHIHVDYVEGKDLAGLLSSLEGFSHGFGTGADVALQTKVNELPTSKLTYSSFKWIKIQA